MEPTIITIADFYSPPIEHYKLNSTNDTLRNIEATTLAKNVQIDLPGFSTVFNVSINSTENYHADVLVDGTNSPNVIIGDWDEN